MVYSAKLRALRDAKGVTNHELADISGVPESTVSRLMSGQTDNPSLANVCDIVRALDGSMDEVMGLASPVAKTEPDALQELIEKWNRLEAGLEHLHRALAVKDRWIMRMFTYSCILTLLFIATLIAGAIAMAG